ncbi:hypothetical protein [Sinomonas humi]|uniref:hypothetical protein n=1 Tax=Sinomonas humi TaxID=1338436 RepID=UPI0012DFEA52|nr:hypothetical protein [Sinomonas humi]
MIRMVRIRKASRAGVTARFVAGHFTVTHDGLTEPVQASSHPVDDDQIMQALEAILELY